ETPDGPLVVWVVDMPRTLGASRRVLFEEAAERVGSIERVMEADGVGRWVLAKRRDNDPLFTPDVVVGDFNTPGHAWSVSRFHRGMRPVRTDTGMGPAGTWPGAWPLFEIDLARLGPDLRAVATGRIRCDGARHLGLWIDLARQDRHPGGPGPGRGRGLGMLVQASVGKWGLGNMLFPWARAEVFCERTGARMIAPQWTHLNKIGPLLRKETDLRYYTNLFDNRGYVRGPARWSALLLRKLVKSDEAERLIADGKADQLNKSLIDFKGYDDWFREDLPRHRDFVRRRLDAITAPAVKKQIAEFDTPLDVVVHIRRGDMRVLEPGEEFGGRRIHAESEAFFVAVIEQVRTVVGDRPLTVFTNARPGELSRVPGLPGVHHAPGHHSALTDMWLMSRAKVLITSSLSSFSAWASYLGGTPTIWHRPNRLALVPDRPELAIEVGPDGVLPDESRAVIADAFKRSPAARGDHE
ncbi:MAG: hypothetical protein K8E66_02205, partial [Phycisphaerales bacterium]|nr:hypothetical protein [Phycisphaerales bacterium]